MDAPLSRAWHVLWGPTGTPWGRAEGGKCSSCVTLIAGKPRLHMLGELSSSGRSIQAPIHEAGEAAARGLEVDIMKSED